MEKHTYKILAEVEDRLWWHVARTRIILSELDGEIPAWRSPPLRILDAGCGTGKHLEMLRKYGQPEGIDISDEAVRWCRVRGLENVYRGDCTQMDYPADEFDLVTALDLLEHIEDDEKALREFRRVLKPDGRLLVFVPAFRFLWGLQDEVSLHRRRYTREELRGKLETAGFEIIRTTYVNMFLFLPIFIGRMVLRLVPHRLDSENRITAPGLNALLMWVFSREAPLLRLTDLPFGVSLMAVAKI